MAMQSVEKLAWNAALKAQGRSGFPDWVLRSMATDKRRICQDVWRVEAYLFPKKPLKEGERWDKDRYGRPILVDAEGNVALSYQDDESQRQKVFVIDVNEANGTARVVEACDASALNEEDYQQF